MNDDALLSLVTSPPSLVIGACCIALLKQEMTKICDKCMTTWVKKTWAIIIPGKPPSLATQWSLRGALLNLKKWCKIRVFTLRNEQNGHKFLYVTIFFFPSNKEPQKRGEGGFFSNHNFPPQSKRNQVESKKVGFSKPQFHSPKKQRDSNSQSEPKFPSPLLQRETTLHRLGQGEPTTTVGTLTFLSEASLRPY